MEVSNELSNLVMTELSISAKTPRFNLSFWAAAALVLYKNKVHDLQQ
jgi:hypothetical protein